MILRKKSILLFLIIFIPLNWTQAQFIPEHKSYTLVYDFMDELANNKIIEINSAIKPYSRDFIAQKLLEAYLQKESLSQRQQKELLFYLNEFAVERDTLPNQYIKLIKQRNLQLGFIESAIFYHDSLFKLKVNPVIGMQILNNQNGNITRRWFGAEIFATMGKHLSIYASFRDNSNQGELLAMPSGRRTVPSYYSGSDTLIDVPSYLTQEQGGSYKIYSGGYRKGGDYSEMRGGIYYSWKWGRIGLSKDHVVWGDNYNGSNILSGRTPSFPMISLQIKPVEWAELNYFHAWLVSNVIDSTNYYVDNLGARKYRYQNKYMAANMLTITPFKQFKISLGNSIIYSEDNIQPAYLIPLMFYKSVDHTLTMGTENQNSQVFFNVSSRNIKHVHLYSSIFIDEFSIKRLRNEQRNPSSIKAGIKITDFLAKNYSLLFEFTQTNIIVYKHSIPSLTYASSGYSLGHYLGDNSQEYYTSFTLRPLRAFKIQLSYLNAQHGNEYQYLRRDDTHNILETLAEPVLKDITWKNETYSFQLLCEIFSNAYANITIDYSNIKANNITSEVQFSEIRTTAQGYLNMYTPQYLQGKKLTTTVGFSYCF